MLLFIIIVIVTCDQSKPTIGILTNPSDLKDYDKA